MLKTPLVSALRRLSTWLMMSLLCFGLVAWSPAKAATPTLLATGFNLIDAIASDGAFIYVGTHDGKLFRMTKTGTDLRNIANVAGFIGQILFNNGNIWFYANTTNFGGASIYVMPQDLSAAPTVFLSGVVKSMGITGSTLYYWDGDDAVKSIPLGGGTPELLLPHAGVLGFAVDGTSIFLQTGGFGVSRLDAVTKTISSVIPQVSGSSNVFVDTNNVYGGGGSDGAIAGGSGNSVIYQAPKQGGTVIPLVDGALQPGQFRGLRLSDGNFVYYTEGPGGVGLTDTLKSIRVGGGTPIPLTTTLISARYMINVNGTLYWSTPADAPGAGAVYSLAQASVPIIAQLTPNNGPVGAPLFIQGSYFGAQQNTSTVSICGVSPAVTKWSDTLIALAVPNFPAGTVCNVRVSTSQGEATPAQYTITKLTSVSGRVVNQIGDPLGGVTVLLAGPTSKTITTTPNGQYLVNGIPSGDYTATLYKTGYQFSPSPKTVSVNGVADVTGVNFVGSAIMPALTKISPDHQKDVALPVILTGTGFGFQTLDSKVLFGGIEARINSWSPTSIEVVPPFLPASVLVQVITSAGKSNSLAFQYPTKNLNVAYSLENPVDGLVNGVYPLLPIVSNVSSTPNTVTKDISVTNPTQTWYVLYVQKFGNVTGVAVGSGGVLIGPGETLPIGRVAFQSKSSLRVYVNRDAFPNCAPVIDCARQTRLIQTAQAGEVFWRLIAGSPFPVSDDAKALLVGAPAWSGLATDTWALLQGDVRALLSIPNDVFEVLNDPVILTYLVAHGIILPPIFYEAVIMYRAGLVVSALAETLIYPHSGAILFEAK